MIDRTLTVSADDLGLSKGNTDTIFETVDAGTVTSVSILPNGLAFDYAIEEYKKRPNVRLAVHLNLTEGKPLTTVPDLVGGDGAFKGSSPSLMFAYIVASSVRRARMRAQARTEIEAQVARVKDALGLPSDTPIAVDGHQHIHMFSFVFDAIMDVSRTTALSDIRIPDEPFFFARPLSAYAPQHVFSVIIAPLIVGAARRKARDANVGTNDAFVGVLFSGHMFSAPASAGLQAVAVHPRVNSAEILFHPGSALPGELDTWKGNTAWHYDRARVIERAFVKSDEARTLFGSFRDRTLAVGFDLVQLIRYSIAGSLAAIVHLGGLYALTTFVGVWYVVSNILGFCGGFVVSFTLQKFWTFKNHVTDGIHHQAFRYALVQGTNLGLNSVGLYLLVTYGHIWYFAAELVMLALIAFGNFFIFKFVIFKHHDH